MAKKKKQNNDWSDAPEKLDADLDSENENEKNSEDGELDEVPDGSEEEEY